MDLISVIVPVYKVEKYINSCVESIVNQTYKNIEVILVDDGSPDNCPLICDEWAKKDDRIKVIHKENGGLSDARNAGMKVATGEYIAFVDSDDLIYREYIECLYYNLIGSGAEIAACGIQTFWNEGEIDESEEREYYVEDCDVEKALTDVISSKGIHSVVWNKLYAKDLLLEERFENGRYHEDEFFTYRIVGKAKKIVHIEKKLYLYRQREGSIMSSITMKHVVDKLDAFMERLNWLKHHYPSLYQQEKADICIRLAMCYRGILQKDIENKREVLTYIKNARKNICFNYKEIRGYSSYNQIYIMGTAINMDLFCKILEKRVPME